MVIVIHIQGGLWFWENISKRVHVLTLRFSKSLSTCSKMKSSDFNQTFSNLSFESVILLHYDMYMLKEFFLKKNYSEILRLFKRGFKS